MDQHGKDLHTLLSDGLFVAKMMPVMSLPCRNVRDSGWGRTVRCGLGPHIIIKEWILATAKKRCIDAIDSLCGFYWVRTVCSEELGTWRQST